MEADYPENGGLIPRLITLVHKVPTADLENDAPLRPDEDAYGVTYDQIDDFLEGKKIEEGAQEIITTAYRNTAHKRALPVAASDEF